MRSTVRWPCTRLAGAALAALLVLAGCAGSSDSGDGPPSTTSTNATDQARTGTETPAIGGDAFVVPPERFDQLEAARLVYEPFDYATQPAGTPWPTDEWPTGSLPAEQEAEVQDIVDEAFGELSTEGDTIDAIVIVKDGELVVEEYNDWDHEATHMSWSVAKSINSALVGILVGQGELDIWEPVGAPEWDEPDDPRAEITLDQLLRMSSGLQWEESYTDEGGDVIATLGGDADRANYAADKPLLTDPDQLWYYSTGTSNLIGRSVAEQVGYGDELTAWIDEALLAPLGIDQVEHSLDATGLHSAGSWINLTPRDFARFGLLYARGGIWEDDQLLPEGWVDYSRMPTFTAEGGIYGAQWWLDPDHPGLMYASGYNGQSVNVFPEEDLVIVVLSTSPSAADEQVRQGLFDVFGV